MSGPGQKSILVIGASGFIGRRLCKVLLAGGHAVRCLARDPAKIADMGALGCSVVKGEVSDAASVVRALDSVRAVYVAMHTLSPQPGSAGGLRFMEVELNGLRNVAAACEEHGVRRVVYVTSLGVGADASSEWLRERWKAEQLLLASDLDVTVIRPGMIVGIGGRGFGMVASQARKRVAVGLGGHQRMRTIAIDNLIYYLVGVLDDARAFRQCYDVGSDDVLTTSEMVDAAAKVLGRGHPVKVRIPPALLGAVAPLIERLGGSGWRAVLADAGMLPSSGWVASPECSPTRENTDQTSPSLRGDHASRPDACSLRRVERMTSSHCAMAASRAP